MQDHTPQLPLFTTAPNNPTQEIPYGYCHCGCGQKTRIATQNDKRYGKIKGEPMRYLFNHQKRKPESGYDPNPSGLCMCGCGQAVPIADKNHTASGVNKGGHRKYISGHNTRGKEMRPIKERFWEKVDKHGPMHDILGTPCWEWQSTLAGRGYGIFSEKTRYVYAHRFSYKIHFGSILKGLLVCHKCDNPKCVNPDHLFLGTHQDNMDDMVAKGRNKRRRSRK